MGEAATLAWDTPELDRYAVCQACAGARRAVVSGILGLFAVGVFYYFVSTISSRTGDMALLILGLLYAPVVGFGLVRSLLAIQRLRRLGLLTWGEAFGAILNPNG